MGYCTQADIEKELDLAVLIDLTDDPDNPTGEVGAANVESAIVRASAVVDGYLSAKVSVPAAVTPTLTAVCVDIAVYTLFSRKENVPKNRGDRYGAAINFLRAVVDGKAMLGTEADGESRYPIHSGPTPDFYGDDVWSEY